MKRFVLCLAFGVVFCSTCFGVEVHKVFDGAAGVCSKNEHLWVYRSGLYKIKHVQSLLSLDSKYITLKVELQHLKCTRDDKGDLGLSPISFYEDIEMLGSTAVVDEVEVYLFSSNDFKKYGSVKIEDIGSHTETISIDMPFDSSPNASVDLGMIKKLRINENGKRFADDLHFGAYRIFYNRD